MSEHEHGHNPNPDPALYRREPVSFVRRGDRMTTRRQLSWDRSREAYILDVPRHRADTSVAPDATLAPEDIERIYGRTAPLVVDVGPGLGESTVAGATAHPDWNFLAVEVYTPGLGALLVEIEDQELSNIRGVQANAPEVLERLLPPASAQEIWVFFPDPWHKTKHHKRRLISPAFADRAARALVPGGILRLATDWSGYAVHMRQVMEAHPEFTNLHPGRAAGEESPLTRVRLEERELEVGAQPLRKAKPSAVSPDGTPLPAQPRAGLREAAQASTLEDPLDHEGGWAPRFATRPLTSFESKAERAGRLIFDLAYQRS